MIHEKSLFLYKDGMFFSSKVQAEVKTPCN